MLNEAMPWFQVIVDFNMCEIIAIHALQIPSSMYAPSLSPLDYALIDCSQKHKLKL